MDGINRKGGTQGDGPSTISACVRIGSTSVLVYPFVDLHSAFYLKAEEAGDVKAFKAVVVPTGLDPGKTLLINVLLLLRL